MMTAAADHTHAKDRAFYALARTVRSVRTDVLAAIGGAGGAECGVGEHKNAGYLSCGGVSRNGLCAEIVYCTLEDK